MNQTPASRTLRLSIITAIALLCALAFPHTAGAAGGYCAIAYSRDNESWGDSYSWSTRAEAERAALRNCSGKNAFIAGWGYNQHIALAVAPNGAWGFGVGPTASSARSSALEHCAGSGARIICSAYSFK